MLSSTARAAWPMAGQPQLENNHAVLREPQPWRAGRWSTALRRTLRIRRPAHPVFLDARGVWAWSGHEPHAAATRHARLQDWLAAHPQSDLRLWISGHLMGGSNSAWPGGEALLALLSQQARLHGVRVQAIEPWWSHAFETATRCVGSLRSSERAAVCVVEGAHVAWALMTRGVLDQVRHHTLEAASVAALRDEIGRMAAECGVPPRCTVVLGQGLVDGAATGSLGAAVLGRLDGEQPPQWLRPSLGADMD